MSTNTIIALVVGAVVVVGGGFAYLHYGSTKGKDAQMMSGQQTFAAILAAGQNVQCDVTQGEGPDTTSGRVYLADGGERIRGDFTVQSAGKPTDVHLIRSGGSNYVWGSFYSQGIKMQVTAENRGQLFESKDTSIPDDVEYHCTSWDVDAGMFALPENVTFVDMMAQMQGAMPGTNSGTQVQGSADVKAMQCAACDQAGPNRDQCRQALGCN